MTAKITFTATHEGETFTRTSGTMPYVAVTVGSQVQWHKSFASAEKAAVSRTQTWKTGTPAKVVPALPTAIVGKLGDWTPDVDGWGDIPAEAFAELVAAKDAPKVKAEESNTVVRARVRRNAKKSAQERMDERVEAAAKVTPTAEDRAAAAKKAMEQLGAELNSNSEGLGAALTGGKAPTKKQLLGAMVHAAARAALMAHDLPAGMTREEAEEVVAKWLQYIPTPANPGGWQPKA